MPAKYPSRTEGAVFKRLETDAEFHARLIREGTPLPPWASHVRGEELDNYAWGHHRKQRRMVEDVKE